MAGATAIRREVSKEGQIILVKPAVEAFGDAVIDLGVGVNIGGGGGGGGVDDSSIRNDGNEHIDDAHEIFFEKGINHDDGNTSGGYGGFTPFSGHTTSFGPSSSSCSACKCQECKHRHDNLISSIDALTVAVKELTSKRGVIPSRKITEPFTPLEVKRRKRAISKVLSDIKSRKIATPLPCTVEQLPRAIGEQGELKKVNVYKLVNATRKAKLNALMKSKKAPEEYSMHQFSAKDFQNMTNMKVWYEDWVSYFF